MSSPKRTYGESGDSEDKLSETEGLVVKSGQEGRE